MVTDLEIKGGSSRDPLCPGGQWGLAPASLGSWAEPGAGAMSARPAARQSLCRRPGPSVLQQEVGGHVKVVIGRSQGFQSVAPRKSHLHESGDLKTETKPEV